MGNQNKYHTQIIDIVIITRSGKIFFDHLPIKLNEKN